MAYSISIKDTNGKIPNKFKEDAKFLLSKKEIYFAFLEAAVLDDRSRLLKLDGYPSGMLKQEEKERILEIIGTEADNAHGYIAEAMVEVFNTKKKVKYRLGKCSSRYETHRQVKLYKNGQVVNNAKSFDYCYFDHSSTHKRDFIEIEKHAAFVEAKFNISNAGSSQEDLMLSICSEYCSEKTVFIVVFTLYPDDNKIKFRKVYTQLTEQQVMDKVEYIDGETIYKSSFP